MRAAQAMPMLANGRWLAIVLRETRCSAVPPNRQKSDRCGVDMSPAATDLIVAVTAAVLGHGMVPDQPRLACQLAARIVIDDHRWLPGRFFGRFTTSATSGLRAV